MWGFWVVVAILVLTLLAKVLSAFSMMRAGAVVMGTPTEHGLHLVAAQAAYTAALCEWAQVVAVIVALGFTTLRA